MIEPNETHRHKGIIQMSNTASLETNLYSNIGDYIDTAAFSAENALNAYQTSHGPYDPYTKNGMKKLAISFTGTKEFYSDSDIDDDGNEYEIPPDLDIDDYIPFFVYFFSKINKELKVFDGIEPPVNENNFLSGNCFSVPCLIFSIDFISTFEKRAEEIGYTNNESEVFFKNQMKSKEYHAANSNIKAFGIMLNNNLNLDLNGMRNVFYSIINSNYIRKSKASLSSISSTMNREFDGIGEWRK